jgi:hypothetical protein
MARVSLDQFGSRSFEYVAVVVVSTEYSKRQKQGPRLTLQDLIRHGDGDRIRQTTGERFGRGRGIAESSLTNPMTDQDP